MVCWLEVPEIQKKKKVVEKNVKKKEKKIPLSPGREPWTSRIKCRALYQLRHRSLSVQISAAGQYKQIRFFNLQSVVRLFQLIDLLTKFFCGKVAPSSRRSSSKFTSQDFFIYEKYKSPSYANFYVTNHMF